MPLHDASSASEEFELYARAIGHLEKANATSEYVQIAEMPQERDLMRDAQRVGTRIVMTVPWREGQYERIFRQEQWYKDQEKIIAQGYYQHQDVISRHGIDVSMHENDELELSDFYCAKGHLLCRNCGYCHTCDNKSC